jgi:hypothetical protein
MNYGTSAGDRRARVPVVVRGYNTQANDDFQVFYSNDVPTAAACSGSKSGVDGSACALGPAGAN